MIELIKQQRLNYLVNGTRFSIKLGRRSGLFITTALPLRPFTGHSSSRRWVGQLVLLRSFFTSTYSVKEWYFYRPDRLLATQPSVKGTGIANTNHGPGRFIHHWTRGERGVASFTLAL